jgi:5-methylcytosine-specific restriction protein A
MPFLPKRPCPGAGFRRNSCPNLISKGEKYCSTCMPAYMKEKHAQSKEYEARPERQLMKSRRYRTARIMFLNEHPLCMDCLKEGRTTASTALDHREPHHGDYEKFWDQSNWRALCARHHSNKTNREDGGYGNPPGGG